LVGVKIYIQPIAGTVALVCYP